MAGVPRRKVMRREAFKKDFERGLANVLFLVLTAAMAALGAFTSDIWKAHGHLATVIWLFVTALYLAFWWRANPSNSSFLTLALQNEEHEKKIGNSLIDREQLEQAISLLIYQSTFSLATRGMIIEYMRRGITTLDELKEAISELASPIYLEGEEIFGFGGSERWNFAVYLHSRSRDRLLPVWRSTAPNHPSQGPGRVWGRGQGHVGKAFVDGQPIITPDALHPDVERLSAAPKGMETPIDREVYRSFAALPIGPTAEQEAEPYGVLVGTSNRVGRFDKENTAMLVHLADVLASLMVVANVEIDELIDLASGTVEQNQGGVDGTA